MPQILDAPPPAAAPQQASMQGLTGGQPSAGMAGAEGASLQAAVAQKLAQADKLMQEASAIMPNLAGVMDDLRAQMRQRSASIVFSPQTAQSTPPAASSPLLAGLLGGGGQ